MCKYNNGQMRKWENKEMLYEGAERQKQDAYCLNMFLNFTTT
ncbi:MAG: hypothetical protein RL732_207 [Bacteroidota bacterium]